MQLKINRYLKRKQENLSDRRCIIIIQNLIKQRKDSIEAFEKANRKDLIDKEKAEINVIEIFYLSKKMKMKQKKLLKI